MTHPPQAPTPPFPSPSIPTELLPRLQAVAAYVGRRRQVDSDLPGIAADAARFFAAEACSIMQFKDAPRGSAVRLRLAARSHPLQGIAADGQGPGEGLAGKVAASGEALLIEDIARSEHAHLGRRGAGSCICAPLAVAGRVLGVLNLSRPQPFGAEDLALACQAAMLLGMGLELERMQGLLRSRFAHRAMAAELVRHPDLDPTRLGADTQRMARILGKTFFRELRSAGYGSDHILTAATEVIGELGRDIGKGKGKPKGR
jgi:L-methionine (R)-S-oxide reductase